MTRWNEQEYERQAAERFCGQHLDAQRRMDDVTELRRQQCQEEQEGEWAEYLSDCNQDG